MPYMYDIYVYVFCARYFLVGCMDARKKKDPAQGQKQRQVTVDLNRKLDLYIDFIQGWKETKIGKDGI